MFCLTALYAFCCYLERCSITAQKSPCTRWPWPLEEWNTRFHTRRVTKVSILLGYLHRISWACLKTTLEHLIIQMRWQATDKRIFKTAACYGHSLVLGKTRNIHSHCSAQFGTFKTWPHAAAMLQLRATGPALCRQHGPSSVRQHSDFPRESLLSRVPVSVRRSGTGPPEIRTLFRNLCSSCTRREKGADPQSRITRHYVL